MVDTVLPIEKRPRPLKALFLDLNAYFASVEQQERPELRDRPIAVVPLEADTTFVIAASYQAKRFGVKCGTMVRDAKVMCPGIEIVKARPSLYTAYHRRIVEVAGTVLPVEEVCSIDEMRFELLGKECEPENAKKIAHEMKQAVTKGVGECMTSSIGIAPNRFLAKVASDMQKPDGLTVLTADDLPHRLHDLEITDFVGINKRMKARLAASGLFTAKDLCSASKSELYRAFGGIIGERWYYALRGFELGEDSHDRKSLSHSHVLPPDLRTEQGCKEVLLRLIQKATARLRANGLWTTEMSCSVKGFERSWKAQVRLNATQDTITLNREFLSLWESRDFIRPRSVSVWFTGLHARTEFTPSLFEEVSERTDREDRQAFNHAIDRVNQKFGKNTVFVAGMERAKHAADEKIAFQKTELFSEGKGDHEWPDTFRGLVQ